MRHLRFALFALILPAAIPSHGALLGRAPATLGGTDYQAYYDSVLGITWLADANFAATNTFGVPYPTGQGLGIEANHTMTWYIAQDWIAGMNAADYLGVSDWRLPSMNVDPARYGDSMMNCQLVGEYECRNNELGYMYWQNHVTYTIPAPFTNLGFSSHWSSTDVARHPDSAWYFVFGEGGQNTVRKADAGNWTWVVTPGDPLGTPSSEVPEPATLALLSLGLAGIAASRRRKQ